MLVALYIGTHANDKLHVRLAWYLTRLAQKGPLDIVTHVEAIHAQHADGTVTIASASLRDKGVRVKRVALNPLHWIIVDVPQWEVARSILWFAKHLNELYDIRGALATVLPGSNVSDRWFCNESVGASIGLRCPETFGPHQFAAVALTLGTDITDQFFGVGS
jgi:hypothetical protein